MRVQEERMGREGETEASDEMERQKFGGEGKENCEMSGQGGKRNKGKRKG